MQRIGPDHITEFRKQYPQWNAPNGASAQGAESMKVSGCVSAGVLFKNAPQVKLGIGWTPGEKAEKMLAPVVLPVGTGMVDQGLQRVIKGEVSARELLLQAQQQLQTELDEALRG